jgi:pyrroline-5-carboxylate reductase
MKIAFIGGGNMARAIIGGLVDKGTRPTDIVVVEIDPTARLEAHGRLRRHDRWIRADAQLATATAVILAVKPAADARGRGEGGEPRRAIRCFVSIAAGIRLGEPRRAGSGAASAWCARCPTRPLWSMPG